MAEPSTRKVQITVPTADTSVIEWLDAQYSASDSIRRLIRESIAREGFTDVANRPVRPPARPVYVAEVVPPEPEDAPDASARASDTAPATPARRVTDSTPPTDAEPQADAPRVEQKPDAETAAATEDAHEPPAKTPHRSSASADASATIDDLLGL